MEEEEEFLRWFGQIFERERERERLGFALSIIPLGLGFALSATIHAEHNYSWAKHDNSDSAQFPLGLELHLVQFLNDVILKIPTVKWWREGKEIFVKIITN